MKYLNCIRPQSMSEGMLKVNIPQICSNIDHQHAHAG